MLRRTGPGKTSTDPQFTAPGVLKASLFNFDIDGDSVKSEHANFLESRVAPLLQGDRGHIWMQGSASKSGGDAHNIELSRRRVNKVAEILRDKGILDRQMQLDAVGEQLAQAHANEDETDRAVELVVLPVARESPPPPREVPPPPPVSDQFRIRMLGGLAGSIGVGQVENLFFQILDTRNNLTAFYTYSSAGMGRGLIPRVPLSVTLRGPWNDFRTDSAHSRIAICRRGPLYHRGRWSVHFESPEYDGSSRRGGNVAASSRH